MGLFGKKKPEPPSLEQTMESLQKMTSQLDERVKMLDKSRQAEYDQARKLAQSDKRVAMRHLKRSKMLEAQANKLEGMRENLIRQLDALQEVVVARNVASVMAQTTTAIKAQNLDADSVADAMGDLDDVMSDVTEVTTALSQQIGSSNYDEDELSDELDRMAEQGIDEAFVDVAAPGAPVPARQQQQQVAQPQAPAAASAVGGADDDDFADLTRQLA